MNFKGLDVKQVQESDVSSDRPLLGKSDAKEECRIQISHEEKDKFKNDETKETRFPWLKKILNSLSKHKLQFTLTQIFAHKQ